MRSPTGVVGDWFSRTARVEKKMLGGSLMSVMVMRIGVDTVIFGDPSSVAERTRS
jgi:hypothetical protein